MSEVSSHKATVDSSVDDAPHNSSSARPAMDSIQLQGGWSHIGNEGCAIRSQTSENAYPFKGVKG